MKKIAAVLLVSSLLSTAAFAKGPLLSPAACGYSDYFHLSSDSITNVTIASLTGDQGVLVVQKGENAFNIEDAPNCPRKGGDAKVKYQTDGDNYCELTFTDSSDKFEPEVESTCAGSLKFKGMKKDSLFGNSYSLTFAQ